MRRITLLDELRGSLILIVVFYHLIYDIALFFPAAGPHIWLLRPEYRALREVIPALFILLCGVSCHLSRSNLRRGLLTAALALIITAVSLLLSPDAPILFGILHLLSCCILLYLPLSRLLRGVPSWAGILLSLALFLFTRQLGYGIIGFGWELPAFLWNHDALFLLGFPHSGLVSSDYFPLLPWGFLFAAGSFAGRSLAGGRAPALFYRSTSPGMAAIGRHTLPIYLLHQPVWFGVLALLRALH